VTAKPTMDPAKSTPGTARNTKSWSTSHFGVRCRGQMAWRGRNLNKNNGKPARHDQAYHLLYVRVQAAW